MGRFGKKCARKWGRPQEKAKKKAAEKVERKALAASRTEKLGEKITERTAKKAYRIVYKNWNRIEAYVHAYHWPMMLKVLHEKFGFGYHRIQKLEATMQILIDKVGEDDKNRQKRHIKASMVADIKRRGVEWTRRAPNKEGYGQSFSVYKTLFATNLANDMLDMFEIMWLQALSITFKFGRDRLNKALKGLRAIIRKHPGERAMKNMRDKLEAECFVIKADDSVCRIDLSFCENILRQTADKKCHLIIVNENFRLEEVA